MGLDINVFSDNYDEISELEAFEAIEDKVNLSREFCYLIGRKNVIESGIPELEQIAQLTNCDLSFLEKMENYMPEWELADLAEYEEKPVIDTIKKTNLEAENNIDEVITGLKQLIDTLNGIENLEKNIHETDYDTIGIPYYFSDFKTNKGDGYIGNNFGQDLRNLLRFAEFAKSHAAKTLFFEFG